MFEYFFIMLSKPCTTNITLLCLLYETLLSLTILWKLTNYFLAMMLPFGWIVPSNVVFFNHWLLIIFLSGEVELNYSIYKRVHKIIHCHRLF